MQAGLNEIQQNIALLTNLTEPLQIVDRHCKHIATVYPCLKSNKAKQLAGKYASRIPENLKTADFEQARKATMLVAKDKHDLTD